MPTDEVPFKLRPFRPAPTERDPRGETPESRGKKQRTDPGPSEWDYLPGPEEGPAPNPKKPRVPPPPEAWMPTDEVPFKLRPFRPAPTERDPRGETP
eukprot:2175049-Pleurochrysis_carterae.AAC.1